MPSRFEDINREQLEVLYDRSLERTAILVIELRKLSEKWHKVYHKRVPLDQCDNDGCIKRAKLCMNNQRKTQ